MEIIKSPGLVAESFAEWRSGDRGAGDVLYSLTFHRLRMIAARMLRREDPRHTLQPTALVHESLLSLWHSRTNIADERHFFNLAARAMGQALIDAARRKKAAKRVAPEMVPEFFRHSPDACPERQVDARRALDKLRELDPRVAETVLLRCVEEMTIEEVSIRQGIGRWRVRENYDFGLEWLAEKLSSAINPAR